MLKLLRFNTNGHLHELPPAMHTAGLDGQPHPTDRTAVDALIESEERFRLAAEAAGIGTWDWDIASGRVSFRRASRVCTNLAAVRLTPPTTRISR